MNADRSEEHVHGDLTDPATEQVRQRIQWMCGQAIGQDVLDVGCRHGIVCLILAREGFRCTGVDLEAASLEVARQALAREDKVVQRRVTLHLADATQLPCGNASFDTVLLGEVLEHLTHAAKVLAEAKRVLREGGRLVVTVPHGLDAFQGHKRTYYPISLLNLLQPLFKTRTIDTLNNYLAYTGVKDQAYEPTAISNEARLDECLRWAQALETRCLEKERALHKMETKLDAQIKTLRTQSAAQASQIKELSAKDHAWQRRFAQMEAMHSARLREREEQLQDLITRQQNEWNRKAANQRIREVARLALPVDARVLVISKGDDDLLVLDGRQGSHFPQANGGLYAGHHPADSAEAIAHLEELKAKGAEFLLIPASSFWWLDHYSDFRRHLESHFHLVTFSEETCAIFALSTPPPERKDRLEVRFARKPDRNLATPGQATPSDAPRVSAPADTCRPAEMTPLPAVSARTGSCVSAVVGNDSRREPTPTTLTVGGIFDEFTAACLRPDCTLVTFRPDNWKTILERTPINMLFVESAWHGNGGSWQYKIASVARPMGEELVDLIRYCQTRNIPTVFWNKEDPPHFDRFIHRAPLFDFVFTSDADMIPKYREVGKHERVFALPFAAQPRIHNPILEADRLHNVCFAGAYYGTDHDDRRADMDILLRPALAFGLHIYDRQHGLAGPEAPAYRFPEIYQSAIRGRLEYEDMVKAYKWYKVFLNVNSVKQSPTMLSRRVFELLASGTPVVSAYAKAIVELLGDGIVHLSNSEPETKAHLKRLLNDERYWAQVSLKGIREVFARHTYAHRLAEVCRNVGLPFAGVPRPAITAIASVANAEELRRLTRTLAGQTHRSFKLVVAAGRAIAKGKIGAIKQALPDIEIRVLPPATDCLEALSHVPCGDYVWLVNLNDYYGDNFLNDAASAIVYADADIIGKHTHYEMGSGGPNLRLKHSGHEFRFTSSFSPGSVIAKAGTLEAEHWRALAADREIVIPDVRGVSIDRYNYVRRGGGPAKTRDRAGCDLLATALA